MRPLVDSLIRKSLAPTLGTSPGHFDVVFWLVLGPLPLLLCPGLFLPVLLKASKTLSSPSEAAVSVLDLQNDELRQPPQTPLPISVHQISLPLGCGVP